MRVHASRIDLGCVSIVHGCRSRGFAEWASARSQGLPDYDQELWPESVNRMCIAEKECCCDPGPCDPFWSTPRLSGAPWINGWRKDTWQFMGFEVRSFVLSEPVDPLTPREATIELLNVATTRSGLRAGRQWLRQVLMHGQECTGACNTIDLRWRDCDAGEDVTLPDVRLVGSITDVDAVRGDAGCEWELLQIVLRSRYGWMHGPWRHLTAAHPLQFDVASAAENLWCQVPVSAGASASCVDDPFERALVRIGGGAVTLTDDFCDPLETLDPLCAFADGIGRGDDVEFKVDVFAGSHDLSNLRIELRRALCSEEGYVCPSPREDEPGFSMDHPLTTATATTIPAFGTLRMEGDRFELCKGGRTCMATGVRGSLAVSGCGDGPVCVCLIADGTVRSDGTPRTAADAEVEVYWRRRSL